ncbi:hypothetical protein SDC9_189073 [bioreactor metagenome]|uniref:Uncharacterized protein n=1 Tax=bioreactor metagenome TaxID=1076179 RepID=A0A645HR39_9ZZZZ
MHSDFAAGAGGEHHEPHNAFAINGFPILLNENIAAEAIGCFDKKRRRPGMNPELVRDREVFCHC